MRLAVSRLPSAFCLDGSSRHLLVSIERNRPTVGPFDRVGPRSGRLPNRMGPSVERAGTRDLLKVGEILPSEPAAPGGFLAIVILPYPWLDEKRKVQ